MARPQKRRVDPELEAHKAWLGLLQPTGLVVAPAALVKAQVFPDKNILPIQDRLRATLTRPSAGVIDPDLVLTDFPRFTVDVLEWAPGDLAGGPGGPELPAHLAVPLPDHHETLRPTYAFLDTMGAAGALMLISVVETGADLDRPPQDETRGWLASPQARLERLMRDTAVPVGLLCNGAELRLVYAPRGESSGHVGFPVAEMCTVGGRPILSALHMLLNIHRVLLAADHQRLTALMAESRRFQSEVSTRLSEQVLGALWELLRGFQAANERAGGRVLFDLPHTEPETIYGGLLTVIMRLVFLLYAEDQGLMPQHEVYAQNYGVDGLYRRLREDAGRYPDTLDQRFGAWAGLLTTFRLVFDGGHHGALRLPTRHGQLFNPDEFPFLEGRPPGVHRVMGATFDAPRVSDGVVWRVLEGLLMLDGERLSYRALDVEQVGSVYESMMGFDVVLTTGHTIALRPKNIVIDLSALLAQPPTKRAAWLLTEAETELAPGAAKALQDARTLDELVAALGRRVAPQTPRPLPPGALALQPGVERRRSGSHYTPRELTAPIVSATLAPVLAALGPRPRPSQILELRVCDPAMGSGAFLVETCRQLAEALVDSWSTHNLTPALPPDEDPLLHARRLVAQRCLYGVDKNRFAVNLAKLSLWLVTLARDHAFTFLDHALKHGDSLVGLTREQIGAFHWSPPARDWGPLFRGVTDSVNQASAWRRELHALGDGDYDQRRAAWREAEDVLADARLLGDLCVAAYFGAERDKDREALRVTLHAQVDAWKSGRGDGAALRATVEALRGGERPVFPLHWELEFPEVFGGGNPGFDAMVGNPPFAGKNNIASASRPAFLDWLLQSHPESHGNADLVAHFFRRAFTLIRERSSFGLIATNTISQGDTRTTGLRWICTHGGEIYAATQRVKWPGLAAVVVSVVHVYRGAWSQPRILDGRKVPKITAFLFHGGGHDSPEALAANAGRGFVGSYVLGMGFTFDDTDKSGVASSIAEMRRLIEKDPHNAERIFPYIGGQEVNNSPTHNHHRYVINFGDMSEDEARRWPDLMAIVAAKVKPARLNQNREGRKRYWWRFGEATPALFRGIAGLDRVMVTAQTGKHRAFTFLPATYVYDQTLTVFTFDSMSAFSILQSRPHELWARFFGASMKDDLRYTPSDCFETFPFPPDWTTHAALEAAGKVYYEHRAALMLLNNEGLTKTYNRFHDPDERAPELLQLRTLHAELDRAVLGAYGWTDLDTRCDFFLDYSVDEETWGNKKKPWRYRWPEEVHDEVLARLLELNQRRHEEETTRGAPRGPAKPARSAAPKATPKTATAPKPPRAAPTPLPLFTPPTPEGEG